MQKTIDLFHDQIKTIRTSALSTSVIELFKINYHGQNTPLKHLAALYPASGKIVIEPYDLNSLAEILHTLKANHLEVYQYTKNTLAINVPPPSGEDREKVLKLIKTRAEEAKVAIRNIRKKIRQSTPDFNEKELQNLTDQAIKIIEELVVEKTTQLTKQFKFNQQ